MTINFENFHSNDNIIGFYEFANKKRSFLPQELIFGGMKRTSKKFRYRELENLGAIGYCKSGSERIININLGICSIFCSNDNLNEANSKKDVSTEINDLELYWKSELENIQSFREISFNR